MIYSLEAGFCLSMLYIPYWAFMRCSTFVRFRRGTLWGIVLLSLLLPLCAVECAVVGLSVLNTGVASLRGGSKVSDALFPVAFNLLSLSYAFGFVGFLFKGAYEVFRLQCLMRKRALWTEQLAGNITVHCMPGEVRAFSWMRHIVISESDYLNHGKMILAHEMAHVRKFHTLDMLMLTLYRAFLYWNPVVWNVLREMACLHEYEADAAVVAGGCSVRDYQLALLAVAARDNGNSLVHNFDRGFLKSRVLMLGKRPSRRRDKRRSFYLLPVSLLLIGVLSLPQLQFAKASFLQPTLGGQAKWKGEDTKKEVEAMVHVRTCQGRKGEHLQERPRSVERLNSKPLLRIPFSMGAKSKGTTVSEKPQVYYVNGKEIKSDDFAKVPAKDIKSIVVKASDGEARKIYVQTK